MPAPPDHVFLLEAAQRELAEARLSLLRNSDDGLRRSPACARLGSPEGQESLERAVREHRYSGPELALLPQQLAEVARSAVLLEGQRWLAGWSSTRVSIRSQARPPSELLSWIAQSNTFGYEPDDVLGALNAALQPHVSYCVELWERAERLAFEQRTAAEKLLPVSAPVAVAEPAEPVPAVDSAERASEWLSKTDDAARELIGWLVKRTQTPPSLSALVTALRASQLDGLARPARRFYRLAAGARKLGFERDMTARMHGEDGNSPWVPVPCCLPLSVPNDVRVVQPALDYGLLSDLAVAQGLGEGLALALVSPAIGSVLSRPLGVSVSKALGGLFLQLRAESNYLRRIDELEPEHATRAARHAALWILVRGRLAAARLCASRLPARSAQERIAQLMAAGERALGYELPRGLAAVTLLGQTNPEQDFEAIARGCELHAALRERYDVDFYLNPRVGELLRGAAARGNSLDANGFAAELSTHAGAGLARLFEILG
jgi:hypothetical protein